MAEISIINVTSVKARTIDSAFGGMLELEIADDHQRSTTIVLVFDPDTVDEAKRIAEAITPTLKGTLLQFVRQKEPV